MTGALPAPGWLARVQPWLVRGWPAAYLLGVAGVVWLRLSHWVYDDPYITYRYADNLRQGMGLVYNPGELVLSTTSPLLALLLAGLGGLWPNLPLLANALGALSLAAGALFLRDMARSFGMPRVGWACLLLYPTFPLLAITLGSETLLYLAFCLGAIAFYIRERFSLAAVLAALALLARADGILVALVLGADYTLGLLRRQRRAIPWAAVFAYLLVALPWFIFAGAYYGSPLPATLSAKQHQGQLTASVLFAPGFLALARGYAANPAYLFPALIALPGLVWGVSRRPRWLLFLAWPVLYFVSYTLLGVTNYFWYYAPLVPGWLVSVGLGFEWLWQMVRRAPVRFRPLGAAAILAGLALAAGWQGWVVLGNRPAVDTRVAIYRAAGHWLRQNAPPDSTIGTLEVGIIGYYAQRPMLDFAGLLQPDVAAQLSAESGYEQAARWAIDAYRPEFLVLNPAWFPGLLAEVTQTGCALRHSFPGDAYGFAGELRVYACDW